MRRQRRNRRPLRMAPLIQVVENTALASADTPSNTTLYNPPLGSAELESPSLFNLRSCRVTFFAGEAVTRCFAVIRRIPVGYNFPGITIASNQTSFVDVNDVLAYGLVEVYGSATTPTRDPWQAIDLTILKRNVIVYPGDTIGLQVVSNAASTSQTYSAICEFNVRIP